MKKVLFVINTLGHAGAEVALLGLFDRMEMSEYDISLYVMMAQGEMAERIPREVKILNKKISNESVLSSKGRRQMVKTVIRSLFRNGGFFKKLAYIASIYPKQKKAGNFQTDKLLWRVISDGAAVQDEEYDFAVAYLEGGATYYVADHVRARKKAAFVHIDYTSTGYLPEMDKDCYDKIDYIFAVSGEVKQHFSSVYPQHRDKIYIFNNILMQDKIKKMALASGGFGDSYRGIRLLTVGRLTYQKGYDIAIDAMRIIKDKCMDIRWYVIGEGPERAGLEAKISSLQLEKDFILLGQQENPYPYFAQADIYVHATRFEGKSIAVQEAQILGCAIIASDCNGNLEQIEDGKDGILVTLDPPALAAAIISLAQDEVRRKKLSEAVKAKKFSFEEDYENFIRLMEG